MIFLFIASVCDNDSVCCVAIVDHIFVAFSLQLLRGPETLVWSLYNL